MEGNLCFKIDWASLIVGRKFTVFALFYFVFEGNFPSKSPRRGYIWRAGLGGLYLEGLIFGILRYFINLHKHWAKSVLRAAHQTKEHNSKAERWVWPSLYTSNSKREFVTIGQVSPLRAVYCS